MIETIPTDIIDMRNEYLVFCRYCDYDFIIVLLDEVICPKCKGVHEFWLEEACGEDYWYLTRTLNVPSAE